MLLKRFLVYSDQACFWIDDQFLDWGGKQRIDYRRCWMMATPKSASDAHTVQLMARLRDEECQSLSERLDAFVERWRPSNGC